MKLIMENWRKSTLNEQVSFDTIGQVRTAVNGAVQAKKKGLAKGQIKDQAVDALLGVIPGVGSAASIAKGLFAVAKTMYQLPDSQKTQTGLDHLNVDDMISRIVDDGIENEFLGWVLGEYTGLPDDVPLVNIDMTKKLSDFIAQKYRNRTVKVPQQGN